jgi:NAD(P)H-dependent FMN reductase
LEAALLKVLAFNGSPKMEAGNTQMILGPFLEGMREAGADVELYYTARLNLGPCQGELGCMFRTPGVCFQDDDANRLAEKARAADVIVLASPLYVSGVTGTMKNLMDRLTALMVNPIFAAGGDGRTYHPARAGEKRHRLVLVSSCAMWDVEKFDPVIEQMRAIDRDTEIIEFAGALLRPHAEFLRGMLDFRMPCRDVLEAAREAGRQLVRDGGMSDRTLTIVSRRLVPLRLFVRIGNAYTRRKIGHAGKREQAVPAAVDAVDSAGALRARPRRIR